MEHDALIVSREYFLKIFFSLDKYLGAVKNESGQEVRDKSLTLMHGLYNEFLVEWGKARFKPLEQDNKKEIHPI